MYRPKKHLNRREKELLLGHVVAWGAIVTALTLAISLVPASAAADHLSAGSASDAM